LTGLGIGFVSGCLSSALLSYTSRLCNLRQTFFLYSFPLAETFPFLLKLAPRISYSNLDFFVEIIKDVLDQRETSGEKIQDTVGALLEIRQKSSTDEFKNAGVTHLSSYAQAYQFFSASYFGILTAIEYTSYYLAVNPEAKKKAVDEVDEVLLKHKGVINHETLADMKYLTAAIQESFRISTGFFRIDRQCTKDWDWL